MIRKSPLPSALAGVLLALCAGPPRADDAPARLPLALMGTIPLYWGESDGIGELLDGGGEPHWARARLERRYELHPLAYLDPQALAPHGRLLLAQPRALSGEENVALDAWVRGGGRLLIFADPMRTGRARCAIGDRRRPQDVTMLTPILRHWGLELEFDEDQDPEPTTEPASGLSLPVALPGRFRPTASEDRCTISETRVLARCRVGEGVAMILADAALLDGESDEGGDTLDALVALAFDGSGEDRGS